MREYKATLNDLNAAQKELSRQAALIDNFNRQVVVLREARAEFSAARAQVAAYAAEVAKGGASGAGFAQQLADAQNRLRGASNALAQQVQITREARSTLQSAGIATNDLSAAQQRLVSTTTQAANTTQLLTAKVKEFGIARDSAEADDDKSFFFGKGGRTTLGVQQRILGQVYSLTAAYIGLFGVINGANSVVQAASDRDALSGRLSIAFGTDRSAIDAERDYVKKVVDQIGIDFGAASLGYAKIAADIKLNNKPIEEAKYLFETFSKVARVAGLTAAEQEGVFRAIGQTYSVGKVQAEELNQLSERIPAVRALAQQALKDVFPNLQKALELGQVAAEYMPVIAQAYEKAVGGSISMATLSLSAQQARFNNELRYFKEAVGDAGFIKAYTEALMTLTQFLKSSEGQEAAKGLGLALKTMAEGLVWVVKNIDGIVTAFQVLSAVFLGSGIARGFSVFSTLITEMTKAGLFYKLGQGVAFLATSLASVRVAALAAFPALGPLGVAVAAIAAAFGAWELGKWAYDNFKGFRDSVTWLTSSLQILWVSIKGGFAIAMDAIPGIAKNAFAAFLNTLSFYLRAGLTAFAQFAKVLGADQLAGAITGLVDKMTVNYTDITAATSAAREKLAREVAEIKRLRDVTLSGAGQGRSALDERRLDNRLNAATDPRSLAATTSGTPFPGSKPSKLPMSEGEIDRREKRIDALRKSLDSLEAQIERAAGQTLETQLKAVDTQYRDLANDIKALGGKESVDMLARLERLKQEKRLTVTNAFNKQLADSERGLQNKVQDLEARGGKQQVLDLEARRNAIATQYADLYTELELLRARFEANGRDTTELDAARKRIDAGIEELKNAETRRFNLEELNRLEARTNEIIKLREARLDAINAQQERGLITDAEATQQRQAALDELNPRVVAAAQAARDWAMSNEAIFARPEDKAIFIAQMDALIARTTAARTQFTALEQAVFKGASGVISQSIDAMADSFGKVITAQQSLSQGFRGLIGSFAQFAAAFLREIALMIIKQQIFNALAGMGGTAGQIGTAGLRGMGLPVPVKHSGGVIGGVQNRTRSVSPAWFSNAPRYHTGGVSGLAPDEYPAILQKGEEVLAKDSPRNILNGGAGMSGGASSSQGVRVVLVDDRAKVPEAMNSPEGEQVVVQAIRRNLPTIRAMMRS